MEVRCGCRERTLGCAGGVGGELKKCMRCMRWSAVVRGRGLCMLRLGVL